MQDRSCSVALDDNSDTCPGSVSQSMVQEALPELSSESAKNQHASRSCDAGPDSSPELNRASRLIEFPGRTRAVPEWRKQLNQRVREVQERKAREAAEELAAAQAAGLVSCSLPSGQLELVPNLEQPVMNPIVEKALERLDRARRGESLPASYGRAVAAAPAMAPSFDDVAAAADEFLATQVRPRLTVVSPPPSVEVSEPEIESVSKELETVTNDLTPTNDLIPTIDMTPTIDAVTDRKTVRVISEDDAALSYLDICLSVPALAGDTRSDLPSLSRRFLGGVLDLIVVAVMASPAAAAVYYTGSRWTDPRVIELLSGVAIATMFAYMTVSIAFTGRTLAMRMLSLKTIDLRTGLIPTGGQSIGRAVGFVFSLALLGLGQAYALIDPDKRTVYDRLSNTIVVRS